MSPPDGAPVVVVTGGGAGIGAAIATELGRRGALVAVVDPMVSLDGSERLPEADETTAGRIVAAGGRAEAFPLSVTDPGLEALLSGLVERHGRLDAVVNVAGITRPTSFARGSEEDWREVVAVHLGGYLNVLRAALPIMAEAGHGRILGVTSGSGWRAADAGAYGCAKRAVAALTWQLGRVAPPGVTINAISPIAVTRMVTEALRRAASARPQGGGSGGPPAGSATGGLALGAMPRPEELAPVAAHLVDRALDRLSGQVLFTGGSEVALVRPPELLEVIGTGGPDDLAALLEDATAKALGPAEAAQASTGGGNPRLPSSDGAPEPPDPVVGTCLVVSDRAEVVEAVTEALTARGVRSVGVVDAGVGGALGGAPDGVVPDGASFPDGARVLDRVAGEGTIAPVDAVVVALGGRQGQPEPAAAPWRRVLDDHRGLVARIPADAGWARAVADVAAAEDRPVRLVSLVDARDAGGRSRAQAAAQLSRAAARATDGRVAAFAVAVEAPDLGVPGALGEVAAHLVCSPTAEALSGGELVLGDGWFGLRSHPRPATAMALGGTDVPAWFDEVLRAVAPDGPAPEGAP